MIYLASIYGCNESLYDHLQYTSYNAELYTRVLLAAIVKHWHKLVTHGHTPTCTKQSTGVYPDSNPWLILSFSQNWS